MKLKNNILDQLKYDRDASILIVSKWPDKDIDEMISIYFDAMKVSTNESIYLIIEEKYKQLVETKRLKNQVNI